MAVPKRRTSSAKTKSRKAANMVKTGPALCVCPKCHQPKMPHRVCPNCNFYDGQAVIAE